MIILKDRAPINTIYYIAGCIIQEIKNKKFEVDELYELIKEKYNSELEYKNFLIALNFLFLLEKIKLLEGMIEK